MSSRAGASAELHPDSVSSATHRSSLFGGSFGAGLGGAASSTSSRLGSASSSMQQALEEDNNRLTDDLSQKVSALRFASQTIHDEVSEQNRLLSGMVRACRRCTLFVCALAAAGPHTCPTLLPTPPHTHPFLTLLPGPGL